MSAETNPSLDASIKYHVAYYREAQEYVSRRGIEADLRKDPGYPQYLAEAGIDPKSPNAGRTFKHVIWPIIRRHCVNLRIRDREKDAAKLDRVYALTEQKCGQFGWSFDPQFDVSGELVHVEVWPVAA